MPLITSNPADVLHFLEGGLMKIELRPSTGLKAVFAWTEGYDAFGLVIIKSETVPWKFVEIEKGLYLQIAISHKTEKVVIGDKLLEVENEKRQTRKMERKTKKTKGKSSMGNKRN